MAAGCVICNAPGPVDLDGRAASLVSREGADPVAFTAAGLGIWVAAGLPTGADAATGADEGGGGVEVELDG